MPETATVEVLTAEVRVLMVGSRQVTLSVYRQLDHVDSPLIEPFGRVRDKPVPGSDRVFVIGRSIRPADYGALVRSSLSAQGQRTQAYRFRTWRDPIWDGDNPGGQPMTHEQREEAAQACDACARLAAEWAELPLIVLAGLR